MYVCIYNPDFHLDDPYVDIVYYALKNRGASGSQNKQTNKQTKVTTRQSGAPFDSSQTFEVGPFL